MRLPSKRILPVLVACIVALGCIAIALWYPQTQAQPKTALSPVDPNSLQSKLIALIAQGTTTNAEWQKAIAESVNPGSTGTLKQGGTTTATGAFAENIFNQYMAYKQAGVDIGTDTEETIIQNAVTTSNLSTYIPQPKVYTINDVTVSNDNSATSLETYADAVATVLTKNAPPPGVNELAIINDVLNNGKTSEISQFGTIITSYANIVAGLKHIKTPSVAETIQIGFLNDFSQALNSVQGMQKVLSDPIAAMAAVQEYGPVVQSTQSDLVSLETLLKTNNVTFGVGELGAQFYKVQSQ